MFGDKSNKRFQHGKKITDQALKKYDTDNVTVAGHSLGSAIAKESVKGMKNKPEVIGVNGAVVPSDIFNKQRKNETMVRSKYDPVSALHSLMPFKNKKRTLTIKPKNFNLLNEHSSDILDRIDPDTEIGV
jgi:hypothetical protein